MCYATVSLKGGDREEEEATPKKATKKKPSKKVVETVSLQYCTSGVLYLSIQAVINDCYVLYFILKLSTGY